MEKKSVVGLLVMVDLPAFGRVAVLQRRGEFNLERMGPESWPGGCQVTAFGGVKEWEKPIEALYREIGEELGQFVSAEAKSHLGILMIFRIRLHMLFNQESEKKTITIWGLNLSLKSEYNQEQFLRYVQLHASSGGLVLLPERGVEEIQDLTKFDKKEGVTDRRVIAMFPDEKEAVRKAFEIFKPPTIR